MKHRILVDEHSVFADKPRKITDKQLIIQNMPKKATISSQNVSVSGMKSRLLDLNNDFWLRVILVPFLGLCVPYFTNVIPPDSSYSFLQSHPSLYSGFAIILIFESNRFVIKQFRKWFKSKDKDYLYYLVRRIVFQLLFTLILLFILLFIWYHFILKSQDYSYYLLKKDKAQEDYQNRQRIGYK